MALHTCHEKIVFLTHMFEFGPIGMGSRESQDPEAPNCNESYAVVFTFKSWKSCG